MRRTRSRSRGRFQESEVGQQESVAPPRDAPRRYAAQHHESAVRNCAATSPLWRCCSAICRALQRLLVFLVVVLVVPVAVFVGRIADRRLVVVIVVVAGTRETATRQTTRRRVAMRCDADDHCAGMRRFWPG